MMRVKYCDYSTTIRQIPENYCLAVLHGSFWAMDPDLAADRALVVALTLSLMEHENKWSKDPQKAIAGMIPFIDLLEVKD